MGRRRRTQSPAHPYPQFVGVPTVVTDHPDFINLSAIAVKLLLNLARQFNGYNNGDLCATLSLLKPRGWNSNSQLTKAKKELLAANLITQTRQGGLHMGPNLYALTWQPIMDPKGKLDVPAL